MGTQIKRMNQLNKAFLESLKELSEFETEKLSSASIAQVKLRLADLISDHNTFLKNQLELEALDDAQSESDIRTVVTRHYYQLRPALEERLEELKKTKGTPAAVKSETLAFIPKLPEISLDSFSGDLMKWKGFIESFDNHVHNNLKLNDLTKLQYLKHSVKGIAARTFENLDFVAANYAEARRLLFDRFDKPNQIVEEHIKALFSIKSLDKATSSKLLNLVDEFNSHIRSLNTLERPVQYWDDLLVFLMCTKLDAETKVKWREEAPRNALPTFRDLCEFIQVRSHRIDSYRKADIDSLTTASLSKGPSQTSSTSNRFRRKATALTVTKGYFCDLCKKSGHSIMRCYEFLAMSVEERRQNAETLKLCTNCLRSSHSSKQCPTQERCRICQTGHHTLLHVKSAGSNLQDHSSSLQVTQLQSTSSHAITKDKVSLPVNLTQVVPTSKPKFVFLATALVDILDNQGLKTTARVLLDSGSQINLMTQSLAKRLGIKTTSSHLNINGIGGTPATSSRCAFVKIQSRTSDFSTVIEAHILKTISTYQPSLYLEKSCWPVPSNIKLADPQFFVSRPIDLLLGAELYGELQSVGQIQLGHNLPILQNTILGWVVMGATTVTAHGCCTEVDPCSETQRLDELLERLWEQDHDETPNFTSLHENECERHFTETFSRCDLGRFVVRLPFSKSPALLGDSALRAKKRFLNLESKLDRDPELRAAYNQFMRDYEQLGHMEVVRQVENPHYFLPHHSVVKPESSSTKLRVVFDGSATTSTGYSLNDILMTGPVVQHELFAVLMRFRSHKYALSADICKMYRQILTHPSDQQYQYIYWRYNPAEELCIYKLKTVTYGTTTAPYLATRCLLQLALENQVNDPVASAVLQHDAYVDDLLTGSNYADEAARLKISLSNILHSAGMTLRKWCSNHDSLLQDTPIEDRETLTKINDDHCVKALGIYWQPTLDHFVIQVTMSISELKRITKLIVISQLASIFDPNGLIAPVIVLGKMFLQRLWSLKSHWDESLPMVHHTYWVQFINNLHDLNKLKIPRHVFNSCQSPQNIQLHGFADASERAYGAVVYVRYQDSLNYHSTLLCAKSRVAPLKQHTLPRLELCAALLLVNLMKKVATIINFIVEDYFYWTDSLITLHWINSPPTKWKTYVANRVSTIQSQSKSKNWLHVESKSNPADLVSRGVIPKALMSSKLWWYGPTFFTSSDERWNNNNLKFSQGINIPEQRKETAIVSILTGDVDEPLDRIHAKNSYNRVCNSMAYVARFLNNTSKSTVKSTGSLTVQEIDRGLTMIVRSIQSRAFAEIYEGLQKGNYNIRDQSLKSLSIFMDDQKILRVGGRLQFSSLAYSSKHAILLPKDHFFTFTVMNHIHIKHLHVGPQGLLAAVRQTYWPINGRHLATKVCKNCVLCTRARPILLQQRMADLPAERVNVAPPFYNVAVDYAGPLYIHYHIRGKHPTKTYLVVFVCFSTKAIHLELASDLTTASFLGALRRFVATRGLCKNIYSDNGTNFVGANTQLHELHTLLMESKDELVQLCHDSKINWQFTPPNSPHFGGLHEAAVKSAKHHIRRMMGNANLSYEELNTLIKQVEAVLNSRPLTSITTDDNIEILTPGHFLIGRPLTAVPEPAISEPTKLTYTKRWQLVNQLYHNLWKRWSTEYLQQLQHRFRWQKTTDNIPEGSIVIIKDDNLPPLKWKYGKVIEQHIGADGRVRVVSIKTSAGIFKRAITNVCPLPVKFDHLPGPKGGIC